MAISARSTARRSRPLTALSEDHPVRQDLSIAGKRKGLAGECSGLYMEQIRIIREMRENDRKTGRTGQFIRPRYMVWENVVGAMSSNNGRDFAAVLEEAIRIAEPEAPDIPVPDKGWPTWGGFRDVDGRWSVAWRVLDAELCEASHNCAFRTDGPTSEHGQTKRGNSTRNRLIVRGIRRWETPLRCRRGSGY